MSLVANYHRNGMEIYTFISVSRPSVSAFTSDETGGNLPADYAPWQVVGYGKGKPLSSVAETVARAVQRAGYFLISGGPALKANLSQPRGAPRPQSDP